MIPDALLRHIRARARSAAFGRYVRDLLLELCRIDTTPKAEPSQMRAAESACFQILERELSPLNFGGELDRRPISPDIAKHPHYSQLHFTKTPSRPSGLTPQETYGSRSNLLYVLRGCGTGLGQAVAVNAHVDVVAPWFSPNYKAGVVFGRGACDDKGSLVAIVGALRVLSELMAERRMKWNRNVVAMFVVEEETGGNGSLSLAIDPDLKALYDSVMVCECTNLAVHPANRGAVWYRAELKLSPGVSPLELAAFVIEELEREGKAIRAESRHPLFPQRPVQTCHGIIGPFGEHPSRICARVSFRIGLGRANNRTELLVTDCLESGLASYIGLYGDKTKVSDPATRRPMVARHYDLRRTDDGFRVNVHGVAGHMGAIRERDGAITKMAHLVRSLIDSRAKLEAMAGHPLSVELDPAPGTEPGETLVLEGGQGFVPTHGIDEIKERLQRAAQRGADCYLRRIGFSNKAEEVVIMTYEKLHNVAFDGKPDSSAMRNAIAAAKACGLWRNEPVLGWTVSCDARLFASEHPGLDVLTFGPGHLAFAHSDHEQITLKEIQAAAEFLAIFLLLQTGTVSEESCRPVVKQPQAAEPL